MFTEAPSEFMVDASALDPQGKGQVQAILTTPSGRKLQTLVDNKKDGTYPTLYTPMEEGEALGLFMLLSLDSDR